MFMRDECCNNRDRGGNSLGRRDGVRHEVLAPGVDQRVRVRMLEHVRREYELGMHGLAEQSHAHLVRQAISLLEVAAETGGDDVGPRRFAAAGSGHDVIDGEALAATVAVLAGVAVPSPDVLLVEGHPVEERLAYVYSQADHCRQREGA